LLKNIYILELAGLILPSILNNLGKIISSSSSFFFFFFFSIQLSLLLLFYLFYFYFFPFNFIFSDFYFLTIISVASKQAKSTKSYRDNFYTFNFKSRLDNKSVWKFFLINFINFFSFSFSNFFIAWLGYLCTGQVEWLTLKQLL
jgi:hypothetical protein